MKTFQTPLSVVLPAHNEEENIGNTVSSCREYLDSEVPDYEIIVVNDGSSDTTQTIVEKLKGNNESVRLINHPVNRGYGAALRTGFDNATKDYIFLMDSDGQFRIDEIGPFLQNAGENNIVIGYRYSRADSSVRSLNKELYRIYIKILFGLDVIDIDCAYKLFPLGAYDEIKPVKSGGALFSAELLIKFKKKGYVFVQLPVNHYPRLHGEQSGANLKVILRMFVESWKFRKELGTRK